MLFSNFLIKESNQFKAPKFIILYVVKATFSGNYMTFLNFSY